ncbi:MAG: hypothetical protein ACRC51_10500 [Cetobacterium sp.]
MSKFFLIMPLNYSVNYTQNAYKSNNQRLRECLLEATENFCMYKYDLLKIPGRSDDGHLDHSIEEVTYKGENRNPLHCKYNIAIVSKDFNLITKKRNSERLEEFSEDFGCTQGYSCIEICDSLKEKLLKYSRIKGLLLMPNPFYVLEDALVFDLENLEFKQNPKYRNKLIRLEEHILNLDLNSCNELNKRIKLICKSIIRFSGDKEIIKYMLEAEHYMSLVEKKILSLFYEMEKNELILYCEIILSN